jgi:drug/metabolite transporter (DMT)-like permease
VLGIALALAGGLVVAISDAGVDGGGLAAAVPLRGRALHGDLLALTGAWMMAGYMLVGRRLRARLALAPYLLLVYGMAAAVLALATAAAGQSLIGLPGRAWLWLVLLALVPQLVGHSSFNWALRHLPAAVVAVAMMGEPVGSATLAYAFLGEVPSLLKVAGAALILTGIALAARAKARPA